MTHFVSAAKLHNQQSSSVGATFLRQRQRAPTQDREFVTWNSQTATIFHARALNKCSIQTFTGAWHLTPTFNKMSCNEVYSQELSGTMKMNFLVIKQASPDSWYSRPIFPSPSVPSSRLGTLIALRSSTLAKTWLEERALAGWLRTTPLSADIRQFSWEFTLIPAADLSETFNIFCAILPRFGSSLSILLPFWVIWHPNLSRARSQTPSHPETSQDKEEENGGGEMMWRKRH